MLSIEDLKYVDKDTTFKGILFNNNLFYSLFEITHYILSYSKKSKLDECLSNE